MKTHRKKQEPQVSNHVYKCKHKKTQRIVGGKKNTTDSLVEKTRKNDKNMNFTEKK